MFDIPPPRLLQLILNRELTRARRLRKSLAIAFLAQGLKCLTRLGGDAQTFRMERLVRLKSEIRVAAILRRAASAGAGAQIVRRGDADAGAIALKIYLGRLSDGPAARLIMEAYDENGVAVWRPAYDVPQAERVIDERLARESAFDRDLWIVEIEDKEGRSFAD